MGTLVSVRTAPSPAGTCSAGAVEVRVALLRAPDDGLVEYVAAAPAACGASVAGSGLPHPSAGQAFHPTPNRGVARVAPDRTATIRMPARPAAYYVDGGAARVPPTLYLAYTSGGVRREFEADLSAAAPAIPFRSLTYPAQRRRDGAAFYDRRAPLVRSQEQILYDSAYPRAPFAAEPAGFWGARPPL